MPKERLRGTSIVWRFAFTSLIVFGLIGIVTLRAGDLRARSEQAATVRAQLVRERDRPLPTPADLEGPIRERDTASSTEPSTSSRWTTPAWNA
jgi:hypothetical protein